MELPDVVSEAGVPIRVLHGVKPAGIGRILALKLDHLGDFLIGVPALRALRATFPAAHVTLVCGPWNRERAESSGLCDRVVTYTFFPRNARDWDGRPAAPVAEFLAATEGAYDLAIDLRVDEDTRFLLAEVRARHRAGIGARERQPYLDILLPQEHASRDQPPPSAQCLVEVGAGGFATTALKPRPGMLVGDFRPTNTVLAHTRLALPAGHLRAGFDCGVRGRGFGLRHVGLVFEVVSAPGPPRRLRFLGREISRIAAGTVWLEFDNPTENAAHEFRVLAENRPFFGEFRLRGMTIERLEDGPQARLKRAELHIGEKLSLLVALTGLRLRPDAPPSALAPEPEADAPIVLAPYSNSSLRDWPEPYYGALVARLLRETRAGVVVIGAPEQAPQVAALLAPFAGEARVVNLAGTLPWAELPALLRSARLVVSNNSGIAHLAAELGAPLLALYSASHQVEEWGPRGANTTVLVADLPCAPCGHDQLVACPHDHACLRGMTPEVVMGQIAARLGLTLSGNNTAGDVSLT